MTALSEQSDPPARVQHLQKQAAVPYEIEDGSQQGKGRRGQPVTCERANGRGRARRDKSVRRGMLTWAAGALKANLPQLHRPGYDMMCELNSVRGGI